MDTCDGLRTIHVKFIDSNELPGLYFQGWCVSLHFVFHEKQYKIKTKHFIVKCRQTRHEVLRVTTFFFVAVAKPFIICYKSI